MIKRSRRFLSVSTVVLSMMLTVPVASVASTGANAVSAVSLSAEPSRERRTMNRRVFDTVWNEVRRKYYDPDLHGLDWRATRDVYRPLALSAPDDRTLYLVLERMLDLLDDEHAGVSAPAIARRSDRVRERRAVVGITMSRGGEGVYRIERVRAGSPAEEAGITVGWTLDTVGGRSGWSPEMDVVEGQTISVRFVDDAGTVHPVMLTPRQMDPLPPFVADRSRPGVLVLRIEAFEPGLGRWMGEQLAGLPSETDVVIDLRSNPGGLLVEADAVLSCFLPKDRFWATRTSRSGQAITMTITAKCGDLSEPIVNDLAILIDAASRSAAELTPAALQEAGRAIVVGQRSAGSVLISQETNLPDGGRLTLSRANFVTAGGVRLEKRGVDPDLAVARAETDDDISLSTAIKALGPVQVEASADAANPGPA